MAANTVTTGQANSSWLLILLKIFLFGVGLAAAFVLFKLSWNMGMAWLLFMTLLVIFLILPSDFRRFTLFLFVNFVITTVVASWLQRQFASDDLVREFIRSSPLLSFLLQGFGESVFWSIVIGLIVSLSLTLIPLFLLSYVSAVYILALHQVDGLNAWHATRYVLSLLLGINQPAILAVNGQAVIKKNAAKMAILGGPGQLIVNQGNVVVLERGGKITRIVNAGVTKLRPLETIRNVFPLNIQSNYHTVDHVLTQDRIPLDIMLTIKFQIEPAAEVEKRDESHIAPDGEALTKKLDDGLYQVYEGTIRKVALTSQATTSGQLHLEKCDEQRLCVDTLKTDWRGVAGGVPGGELRDHIMSHRFDELFELGNSSDSETPEFRINKRKIYEIEQAILEQIKPGKINNLGVLVRGIDIGKIGFPEEAEDLLLRYWGEPWFQQINRVYLEGKARTAEFMAQAIVIKARAKAQARILSGQGEGEARAAFFREVLREMKREVGLGDEVTEKILVELIKTMVPTSDITTLVKATAAVERSSRKQLGNGEERLLKKRLETNVLGAVDGDQGKSIERQKK